MTFYKAMTIASFKMYFREPFAIFWTLFFPILLMLIFGVINFGSAGQSVGSEEISYRDYLVPAIAAMAIMQSNIFGSVFSIIRFKSQGVLRRLQATPVGPLPLLIGQSFSRIILSVGQTYVMLLLGVLIFDVSIGSGREFVAWLELGIVAFLGSLLFLSIGLAISGRLRSENVAAPIANVVTLPMLFLSGVFFPRDLLPEWLGNISQYFPLTFLVDAMQSIAILQGGIGDVWPEVVGILAWTVAIFAIAVRIFKWE